MALGALDVLGSRIACGSRHHRRTGTCRPTFRAASACSASSSGHTRFPTASSLAAGEQLVQFIGSLPADAQVLCLVSGGASSLVEWPVPGIDLADLQRVGKWAMTGGQPIDVVNAVRRQLSQLKGGGLASLLGQRAHAGPDYLGRAGRRPADHRFRIAARIQRLGRGLARRAVASGDRSRPAPGG